MVVLNPIETAASLEKKKKTRRKQSKKVARVADPKEIQAALEQDADMEEGPSDIPTTFTHSGDNSAESNNDDGDDDDMSDFIVESDEDEEEKDAHRELKRLKGKGKAKEVIVISDSEDDSEDDGDDDIIFGAKLDRFARRGPANVKLMPKFLPSTKMKVRCTSSISVQRFMSFAAHDGVSPAIGRNSSR